MWRGRCFDQDKLYCGFFWNVNSRHDIFHADKSRRGVQLASGQSVTVFKHLDCTPVEAMERTIGAERYND